MNVGVEGRAAGGWVVSVQSLIFTLGATVELAKLQIPDSQGMSRPLMSQGSYFSLCRVWSVWGKNRTIFSTVQFKKTHIFIFYYKRWGNSPG